MNVPAHITLHCTTGLSPLLVPFLVPPALGFAAHIVSGMVPAQGGPCTAPVLRLSCLG